MTALLDQIRTVPRAVFGDDDRRPLPVSGMLAAAGTLGIGLAVLTHADPGRLDRGAARHVRRGAAGVFRTACQLWLAAHHAGFEIPGGGRVGPAAAGPDDPAGHAALPGRAVDGPGRRPAAAAAARLPKGSSKDLANARRKAQLILIARAGISLAAPYALLAGMIALVGRNEVTEPFVAEALISHLLLAFLAGSVAVARTIGPWRAMVRLLPERLRSVVVGTFVAVSLMLAAGLVLVLGLIAVHFGEIQRLTEALNPGLVGGVLLALVEGLYLFNAVIWGLAYIAGPGFAIGAGTLVAPTGVKLGTIPSLPLLGALPESGPVPPWLLVVVAIPFAAGAVAGVVVARIAPTPSLEAAPLWGFVCGLSSGAVAGPAGGAVGRPAGRRPHGRRRPLGLGGRLLGHA